MTQRWIACAFVLLLGVAPAQEPNVLLPQQKTYAGFGASDELALDKLYVIRSKVRCQVYDSPTGFVKVEQFGDEDKPLETRALCYSQFFDGTGFEKRYYGQDEFKYVYMVNALPNVAGQVELIIAPEGSKQPLRRMLTVGGARPPPDDDNKPKPVPPGPAPIALDGFRVLFIYESEDKLTSSQRVILTSSTIRNYLKSKCVKGMDAMTPEYRFFDKDSNVSRESPHWQQAFNRPRASLPWLVISNGKNGFEGPLPQTVDETLAKLKLYGGQ